MSSPARTQFTTVDATAVTGADPRLVEMLSDTQRRLAPRRGLPTVIGLHPHVLPCCAGPGSDPVAAGALDGAAPPVAVPTVAGPAR